MARENDINLRGHIHATQAGLQSGLGTFGPKSKLYLNKVGAFGVSTACMWWVRLFAAAQRGSHYAAGLLLATYHLVYADDGCIIAGGHLGCEAALLTILYISLVGFPISGARPTAEALSNGSATSWT